jgi:hypothetical protein
VGAVAVVARTLAAVGGPALRAVVVVDQRGDVGVDAQDDRAARATVAAFGAAEGLELLPVDGGNAVTTASGGVVVRNVVDERGLCLGLLRFWDAPGRRGKKIPKGAPACRDALRKTQVSDVRVTRPGRC